LIHKIQRRALDLAAEQVRRRVDRLAERIMRDVGRVVVETEAARVVIRGKSLRRRWLAEPGLRFLAGLLR
jgi:hypothetical protein